MATEPGAGRRSRFDRLLRTATRVSAAGIVILVLVFVAPSLRDAAVVVDNRAAQAVRLIASWDRQSHALDSLAPGGRARFTLDGESAVRVDARFADGSSASSEPVYFTSGVTIAVIIGGDGRIVTRYAPR